METKKNGLFRNMARNCANAIREFPVAFCYLTAFALIVALPDVKPSDSMPFGVPCLMACLGSLVASLITARKGNGRYILGQVAALGMAVLYLLLFSNSCFFEFELLCRDNRMEILTSLLGYLGLLCTLIFFPFWHKGELSTDASWSTSMRGAVGLMRAGLVALCVLVAMSIITFAGDVLLDIRIFGKFWLTFVPIMLFGSLSIASLSIKNSDEKPIFRLAPFSRGVFTFVSVPLLAIYLLIFYLYLLKVLTTGATPVRDLSYQAIGVFLAFCAQRYLFQQALRDGDNVVARWFNRLSPWLLFLPVVMMSWVIGQRLMKYGITVSRLYVVLINLWMYGVLVWWIVTKGGKIWVIPVSLCAVLTLSSVTNLNVATITEASMRSDLRKGMEAAGWTLPVSDSFFRKNAWKALTVEQRSQKSYLEEEMGIESLNGLIVFDNIKTELTSAGSNVQGRDDKRLYISSKCSATFDSVPDGCTAVNVEDYKTEDISLSDDSVIINIGNCGALMFSMKQLRSVDNSHGGLNKIPVIGTAGKVKGGCVSNIYINAEIVNGGFEGHAYSTFSGTIFMTHDAAEEFIKEKK